METPVTPVVSNAEKAMRQILEKLPIEQILKFRDYAKQIHYRQLEVMGEILKAKGYVEPHLVDIMRPGHD